MPHAGASKGEREVRKGDEVDIDTDRQSAAGAGKTCIHPLLSETVTKPARASSSTPNAPNLSPLICQMLVRLDASWPGITSLRLNAAVVA